MSGREWIAAPCSASDFELIKHYIRVYELDDHGLQQQEFLSVSTKNGLAGFGRVREGEGYSEICSLGILSAERRQGLGHFLCRHLIRKARQPVYLVCIIPSFFVPLGFEICNDYPPGIASKLAYCRQELPVSDPYVAMRLICKEDQTC